MSKFFKNRKVFVHCPYCGGNFEESVSPQFSGTSGYVMATCPSCKAVVELHTV